MTLRPPAISTRSQDYFRVGRPQAAFPLLSCHHECGEGPPFVERVPRPRTFHSPKVDDKVFKTTHSAVHLPPLITSKQKTFRLPLLALTTLNSPENPTQADPSVSVQHFIDPVSGVVITTG